ncbi:hypothetical protein EV363DRAFT_1300966 [Boletus edulis]|nr:hypothetical protein EV363DRAFT_1300966 [Boletus edulis]
MATLPLPSKFLLSNILSLFTNSILGIKKVLMEVETLIKSLAALYASKNDHRRFLITENGNFVLQLTELELIRKIGYETVDKVMFVVPGMFSPPVVNALKKLVKAMIVETEKYIICIKFPNQKMGNFEASDAVAEKPEKGMSEILLEDFDHQKVHDYWASASENLMKLENIFVMNCNDFVDRNNGEDDT